MSAPGSHCTLGKPGRGGVVLRSDPCSPGEQRETLAGTLRGGEDGLCKDFPGRAPSGRREPASGTTTEGTTRM